MRTIRLLVVFSVLLLTAWQVNGQQIALAGRWQFAMDREDKGVREKWFLQQLDDQITLPGTMTENRKGDDITLQTKWTGSIYDSSFFFRPALAKYRQPGNIKIPFWLTPAKHYVGVAWYRKDVVIPADWTGRRIVLFLERAHFKTRVWVDDKEAGYGNSLVAPHEFDLSAAALPGKHTLTIRIDNSLADANVGPDSHSVTDHTQGNWNGIVGNIALESRTPVYTEDIQVYPDVDNKQALVKVLVVNTLDKAVSGTLNLSARSFNSATTHVLQPVSSGYTVPAHDTALVEATLSFGDRMQLWGEFDPALYLLTASVNAGGEKAERKVQFGMRRIKARGTLLEVNGIPVSLRGTVNNCEFPLTGYAPMDVAAWRRVFRIAREHGLNHMRFHSWCPPEAAFVAADELGFYLQPEGPSWPNHGTSLGDGRFIDQYLYDETNRMAKAYGNHPSFCMLAAGNEPAGGRQAAYLGRFVRYWQAKDARRVYTGASVAMSWPLYPESDYMIKSGSRGLNWAGTRPETRSDYRAAIQNFSMPYVTHEMGQWCVFPNFKEISKYTGVTRARNFELFREDLKDHGMANQADEFFMASGKLQALCYKQEIEKSLRTPGQGGFQLLGLQDFPGQGTALVGVLDAFWDEKPYLRANAWRRFCNSTVPLSRIAKFVYTSDETFQAAIELYHFEKKPLPGAVLSWKVSNEKGVVLRSGRFAAKTYGIGNCLPAGEVTMPLSGITTPSRLKLEVTVEHTAFANDWDFWVYPAQLPAADWKDIYVCSSLDAKAEEVLDKGGKVFLNAAGKVVKGKEIVMQFTPVFWNTSWFKMRPPHVTGFVAREKHPLFDHFPTAYYSGLQWWEIVNRAQVMHLEDFPKGFRPIVQPIDTWFMNRKLGLILEARAGKGRILVSSANLSDSSASPASRQLLYAIRTYMHSGKFNPPDAVELSVIKDLFVSPSKEKWDSFTKGVPDELRPGNQKSAQP